MRYVKNLVVLFSFLIINLASVPKNCIAESAGFVWESSYTKSPPRVDGVIDEMWKKAKPLAVVVREAIGGDNPRTVTLKALHTDDTLYVLAQWADETRSDMRDPYVWNEEKQEYERPSKPDDQFALQFPIAGHFDINMLTLSHQYSADVWHWKAGRGNPVGWVDDKMHIIDQKPIPGGVKYSMGGHGDVYIARLPDEGQSAYYLLPKPTSFKGRTVDSFGQREPTGSASDVRGKGVHDGKSWTLEMSRKLNTGHSDDAVIDPTRENLCAIAVLNDELYWRHSVSGVIILRFLSR
jgi:hypothetical protein